MVGSGTIANVAAIAGGSLIGLVIGKKIKEKYQETVLHGLSLCVMMLGLQMAFQGQHILITIASLVIGSILGEAMDIEGRLEKIGIRLAHFFNRKGGSASENAFVQGFLYTSLLYCVGAMAIVGSIQDGMSGNPSTLYTKAAIDGLSGIVYAANMGVGVMFSSLAVGAYQGMLTVLADFLGPYLSQVVIQEISAAGGLMILGVGINMAKMLKIRVGNMLPGLFVAGVLASVVI